MKKSHLIFCFLALWVSNTLAQSNKLKDWHHKSPENSEYNGIGADKLYQSYLKDKTSQTIVVAVIDSGVDVEHEDLDDVIWVNHDEIPDNGKDDDHNGYIDDVHGWNFIGGKDGKNVNKETLEVTRLYKLYRDKYADKNESDLSKKEKKEYALFQKYSKVIEGKRAQARKGLGGYEETESLILGALGAAEKFAGNQKMNQKLVDTLKTSPSKDLQLASNIIGSIMEQQPSLVNMEINELFQLIKEDFEQVKMPYLEDLNYTYNPDFDSRKEIVKDNYLDATEKIYGNNNPEGLHAFHGTHVSGIIGAERNNDIGMNGIADNVRIMSIRTVPDGDERDKDVANAIRYAVDNGASVINMSFGKGQSWNKKVVDKAVKYAAKKDVLIVHAAGNSGAENTGKNNFPNAGFEKPGLFGKKRAQNWLEVGALNYEKGKNSIASFSNYGAKEVDLFAPGVAIYSTAPNNSYQFAQGTSMASPVVAGTAALIRSYYPKLTAVQVKEILLKSTIPIKGKVVKPGTYEKVLATTLSVTGGMLSAENAIVIASKTKGKKKIKLETPKA